MPNPFLEFSLSVVESPLNDTIWTESDTAGHIEMETLVTRPMGTASMSTDSVAVPTSNTLASIQTDLEYLAFSIDSTTLSRWREGEVANNGFLVNQENPSELIGFHSRNGYKLYPYLALAFFDTASTGGGDTTDTYYYKPDEDISIYSSNRENPVYYDGALHLNHSNGIQAHIELDTDFRIDTTSIVLGGRMILYTKQSIIADQVDIKILHRLQSLGDGDSTALYSTVTYTKGSDSLSISIFDYLLKLAVDNYDNYGLDLVVRPYNHDFDHLVFWGSEAEDALKPRVEIDYGNLYKEVTW